MSLDNILNMLCNNKINIILDLDGTLITCESRQMSVLKAALSIHGISINLCDIWSMKRAGANTIKALTSYGFSSILAKSITDDWSRMIEQYSWLNLDSLIPGVSHVIAEMNKCARIKLLTARTRPEWVRPQLQKLNIYHFFDEIIIVKPSLQKQEKTFWLKQLAATAYFGDTENDALAGERAGVPVYLVSTGQRNASFMIQSGVNQPYESLIEAWNAFLATQN